MDAREVERRRPVWAALSDVYLDTETRWFFPRVALTLVRSGYTVPELERIWWVEITPECMWNLWSVAGEWAVLPLDESALIRRAGGHSFIGRVLGRLGGAPLAHQWRAILQLRNILVGTPDGARQSRVEAWSSFVRVYLEHIDREPLFSDSCTADLRRSGLSPQALVAEWDTVLRPIYRELLVDDEKATESLRSQRVLDLVGKSGG
ncbi:MAG: hypothetical protein AB2A00_06515 [Myxococcota bacterium]